MITVKDLKVCVDCGIVYYEKLSIGVCPNYHTNNYEQVSSDSSVGSLERSQLMRQKYLNRKNHLKLILS
jgi:hypothetical protein